jgi:GGDEF domain-containing protein
MNKSEIERLQKENQLLRERVSALEGRITELERGDSALARLENCGLVDEKYFSRRLREAVLAAERYARFLCIVLVDIPESADGKKDQESAFETASRLREVFRQTDIVGLFRTGEVLVLLEEAETGQGLQALRRVQEEIGNFSTPRYSMACFPSDASKEDLLIELLDERLAKLRRMNTSLPAVNYGEDILTFAN